MRRALVLGLLAACQPRPDGDTEPPGEPQVEPAPAPAEPEEQPVARAQEINAKYAEQTDTKEWAQSFEHDGREVHDRKAAILGELALESGDDIADVGAGTGLFTLDFAKAVAPSGTVYAVDVQDYFLEHIAAKARRARVQNTKTVRATQRSVGLADASVDVAFLCDAYHHLEYPKTYLRSLHAALRPGGRLVVIDFEAIPGKSKGWILEHVRGTPEQFKAEIESAGFAFARAHEILDENFFFEFTRKPDP